MLKYLIYLLVIILKFFIPTDKNLIVFGHRAGRRFGDNSRSLFIYINRKIKKKKCVWITKSYKVLSSVKKLGYKSYYYNSLAGLYFSLRAKWHIFDCTEGDINEPITKLSNNINLWHGILFKKLKKNKNNNLTKIIFRFTNLFLEKYIVYPNRIYSKHLLDHYPKEKFKLIVSNSPRNIFMYNNNEDLEHFKTLKEKKIFNHLKSSKKKIIGYFPTWRFNGMEIFPQKIDYFEFKKLSEILVKNKLILVIKKHPNSFIEDKHKLYNKDLEKIYRQLSKLKGFYLLDYNIDLNSIMCCCDLLISDYSGAIFDFLITKRPIIIYAPDLEDYSKYPGLNFDLKKIKIGPIIKSVNELARELKKFSKSEKLYKKKYEKNILLFKNRIFTYDNYFENIIKKLDS